ncbi:MAG: hypothetical protein IJP75_05955 [Bacteroidaceae bacterium]|nr:hypothetical protein [Bacteroidaceae bacterium]
MKKFIFWVIVCSFLFRGFCLAQSAEELLQDARARLEAIKVSLEDGSISSSSSTGNTSSSSYRSSSTSSHTSTSSSSSGLRHKGKYTMSGQSLCVNTGEYIDDCDEYTFDAEFYDDYMMVSGSKCPYSYTKSDGKKVYKDGRLEGFGNATSYWIVDANYNLSYETNMPTPGVGSLTFVKVVSKGETTIPRHNTGGGYTSGGYNNGSSSGGSRSTTNSGTTTNRHTCSLCHGTGKIVRESNVSTYGKDSRRYCSVCGRSYWASSGHSHITCTQCHGKGYY